MAAVTSSVCTVPATASTPTWALYPKCQFCPFFAWWASGSLCLRAFFVLEGASTKVASTMVPALMRRPSASREALSSSSRALPRPLAASSERKRHSVVASGTASPQPTKDLTAAESHSASSVPSSESWKAIWATYMRSIVPRGTGGRPPPALG